MVSNNLIKFEPVKISNNLLAKKHYCQQCGKDMGAEWLLGTVCGKCCRKNHKRVTSNQ